MINIVFNTTNFEQVGAAFAQGFSNTLATSLDNLPITNRTINNIKQLSTELFSNFSSEQLGAKLSTSAQDIFKGTGWSGAEAGSGLGAEANQLFLSLLKQMNMSEIIGDFMQEGSEAFKAGVDNMDMAGNMEHLSSEFNAGMGIFRGNFAEQLDLLRNDIQSVFSNIARDTTLKSVPWLALSSIILAGAPLLTHYVYKKAVHQIGRPKLAQDVRKVGLWDSTTDYVARTVSSVWDATKVGLKWSILTGTGITLTFFGTAIRELVTGEHGDALKAVRSLDCLISSAWHCDSSFATSLIKQALSVSAAVGGLRASVSIASSFYDFVKKALKKDETPIFNEKLQKRIDDLTNATYNINRHGGYMQNLLLFGPGGTGKTMVAQHIARNSNMNYVMMSGGNLAQYIKKGEHVTELTKLFKSAKNSHLPTILFIDECESLCGDRGKMDRSELVELINCFLKHTGEPSKKVMIILATNRKDDLDTAVLSRMDNKLYVGPPQKAERKKIIELYLPTFMTSLERNELFTNKMISEIAAKTENFTGRTIFKMLNAISAMRATTDDNKITKKMINDKVNDFIEQEVSILKKGKSKWISLPSFLNA